MNVRFWHDELQSFTCYCIFLPPKKADCTLPNHCSKGYKKRKNGDETWRWNAQEVPIISSILLFFFAFDEWCLPHKTKGQLQSVQILYFITHVYIFLFKNYGEKHFVKMLYRDMKLCIIIIYYFDAFFFRTKRMNLQKYYLQDRSWLCLRWFITIYSCHHHHSMLKLV